jgi:hypothetical protein
VLGALRAVGLLDADEAEAWRLRLTGPGVERPAPSDRTREAADELLHGLLEAVPVDDDRTGPPTLRRLSNLAHRPNQQGRASFCPTDSPSYGSASSGSGTSWSFGVASAR